MLDRVSMLAVPLNYVCDLGKVASWFFVVVCFFGFFFVCVCDIGDEVQ